MQHCAVQMGGVGDPPSSGIKVGQLELGRHCPWFFVVLCYVLLGFLNLRTAREGSKTGPKGRNVAQREATSTCNVVYLNRRCTTFV